MRLKRNSLLRCWNEVNVFVFSFEYVVYVGQHNVKILSQHSVFISTGCWLFHPSWHLCIYKRMFESENKILTKEGVTHFLELYETRVLPFSAEFSEVMTAFPFPFSLCQKMKGEGICFILCGLQKIYTRP